MSRNRATNCTLFTELSQSIRFIDLDGSTSSTCTMLNLLELSLFTWIRLPTLTFTVTCWLTRTPFIVEGNSDFCNVMLGQSLTDTSSPTRTSLAIDVVSVLSCSGHKQQIGSFFWGRNRLLWQFQSRLGSETQNTCHDRLVIHYGCNQLIRQNVTGFQPLLLRKKITLRLNKINEIYLYLHNLLLILPKYVLKIYTYQFIESQCNDCGVKVKYM